MVKKVTVRQTGTSISATIPREMAERLHIGVGDTLYAIETERGVLLTPYDPDVAEELEAYRHVARQCRNALRELAK
ncbi:MAG: AbrB/MazE/SpoVT family DNA-binding domain-containing protein [Gemmatimonadaceae bacterium]|nr:AbrB/MazE/SpoVT family DNA-binding domain-containing protein [Gemmatimonadaceae bacterium]